MLAAGARGIRHRHRLVRLGHRPQGDASGGRPCHHQRSAGGRVDVRGERQTVEVETTDGRLLSSRVEIPRGHWEAPLSDAEVRDKFLGLARPALGPSTEAAADLVARIETPGALPELIALLRG